MTSMSSVPIPTDPVPRRLAAAGIPSVVVAPPIGSDLPELPAMLEPCPERETAESAEAGDVEPPPVQSALADAPRGLPKPARSPLQEWLSEEGYWYITSAVVHAIGFVLFAIVSTLLPNSFYAALGLPVGDAPTIHMFNPDLEPDAQLDHVPVGDAPMDPTDLSTETLLLVKPPSQAAKHYDDSAEFELAGGGQAMAADGPRLGGLGGPILPNVEGVGGGGGVGTGVGTGQQPGSGGGDLGFGGRGKGHREIGSLGGTKQSERAVTAALSWIARHQAPAGNWSLQFSRQCVSAHGCSGQGTVQADAGATAMALLTFLGAGQTHKSKGPYQKHISKGIAWLIKHQGPDGDLSCGAAQRMYSHGLATIALCETYGMSGDGFVGEAAAKALRFIEQAQHPQTGGWRYQPGSEGDTSVTAWQVMALKSGQMANLGVSTMALENTNKWLRTVVAGHYSGLYRYLPHNEPSPSMTAAGMLCRQYLDMRPDTPAMREGKEYLLAHLPDAEASRDVYYWYYATLVMHNFLGREWDDWNRKMRRVLITTQCREGCGEGSWDPERPSVDKWGSHGGRLYMTCMSALTLEVYYRYLPLFRTNEPPEFRSNTL